MRLIIALAVLGTSLALSGCSRPNQAAYAMPLPSPRLSHPIKVSWANPPYPRSFGKVSRAVSASLVPVPPRKSSKPATASLVNQPPRPPKEPTQARSQPPSGTQAASVPTTAKHYVVVDTVGNCAVVDAKPADGLKIIGDKNGYASSEAANKALRDAKSECKGSVDAQTESKFKAAQAKAEKVGVQELTREDIEGLSDEQIKQLRGY